LDQIESGAIRSSASVESDLQNIQTAIRELEQRLSSKLSDAFQLESDAHVQSDHSLTQISSSLSTILISLRALPTAPTAEETILRRLYFPTITAREESIADAGFGTFDWLLDSSSSSSDSTFNYLPEDENLIKRKQARQSFLSWLETGTKVYHISGKAGSGKSTLMKYLCRNSSLRDALNRWAVNAGAHGNGKNASKRKGEDESGGAGGGEGDEGEGGEGREEKKGKKLVFASYFFWNSGGPEQKTLRGLYQSLLFETLRQCPELIRVAFPQYFVSSKPGVTGAAAGTGTGTGTPGNAETGVPFSFSELRSAMDILVTTSHSFPNHRFCFFIDGLDEFAADLHTDYWDLATDLRRWTSGDSCDIKICVTSRPHEEFLRCFDPKLRMHLHELTHGDVKAFVRGVLEKEAQNCEVADLDVDKFSVEVADRADGVFLWVRLVVRSLVDGLRHRYSTTMLEEKLDKMPRGLEPLFDQLFNNIDPSDRDRSDKVLLLAATGEAKNALMYSWLDNLADAEFPYSTPARAYTDDEIHSRLDRLKSQIRSLTGGLLEVKPRFNKDSARGWKCDEMGLRDDYFAHNVDFFHRTVEDYLSEPGRLESVKRRLEPGFNIVNAVQRLNLAVFKFSRTMPCYFRAQGLGQTALIDCFCNGVFGDKYPITEPKMLEECERILEHHRRQPFSFREVAGQENPGVIAWGQGWNTTLIGGSLTGDDLNYLLWLLSFDTYDDFILKRLFGPPVNKTLLEEAGPHLLLASSVAFMKSGPPRNSDSFPFQLLQQGVSPNSEITIKHIPPNYEEADPTGEYEYTEHTGNWLHQTTTAWAAYVFLIADSSLNDYMYIIDWYIRERHPESFLLVEKFLRMGAECDISFDLEIVRDETRSANERKKLSITFEDLILYIAPPNQDAVMQHVVEGKAKSKGKREGNWLWQGVNTVLSPWTGTTTTEKTEAEKKMKHKRGRLDELNTEERAYGVRTMYFGSRQLEHRFFVNQW